MTHSFGGRTLRFSRWLVPGGIMLLLGGCGLSDQQLTSVLQSVLTTGLTTLVQQGLVTIVQTVQSGAF